MEKIVIDSSVYVKLFVEEEGSPEARLLLKRHEEESVTIYAPDIIILEVMNGLFFKANFPKNQLKGTLNRFFEVEMELVPLQEKLIQKTLDIVIKENITFYDGLFISLAQELNCSLITNDRKHHRRNIYKKIKYI